MCPLKIICQKPRISKGTLLSAFADAEHSRDQHLSHSILVTKKKENVAAGSADLTGCFDIFIAVN
ncbi:hypothetical protein CS542_09810 [Pedobacter sp. IW39]|nr:hypothetical protein CS542_09810 [Pedobacter sp. IW39]